MYYYLAYLLFVDLWVPSLCPDCLGEITFDPFHSASYKQTAIPFEIMYGSGAVVGTLGQDTVTVAGLTSTSQYFGSVNLVSQQFLPLLSGNPAVGILGRIYNLQNVSAFNDIRRTWIHCHRHLEKEFLLRELDQGETCET